MIKVAPEKEAKTKEYIGLVMKAYADYFEKREKEGTPGQENPDTPLAMIMEICGTDCACKFRLYHMRGDGPQIRTFTMAVRMAGSDLEFSQFVMVCPEEEFIAHCRGGYDTEEYYNRLMTLVEKAHNHDD